MIILGIDLGVYGAIAILTGGRGHDAVHVNAVHDMPILRDGPGGRATVNAPLLAEIIAKSHADKVFVEWVGPRPGEGAVGAFSFGRARGVVEGVCAGLSIPVQFLTPPKWKRIAGIAPGKSGAKDAARSKAIQLWPAQAELFRRVKDDGRAEACLIAAAGVALTAAGAEARP
jgi:crossover junction endodeoxyribonuclease RuvC